MRLIRSLWWLAFAIICLFSCSRVCAQAWPNGYSFRRAITINHTKVANANQTNFPVLVSGTYADLASTANGGSVTNANGYDIIFTSDALGANVLPFEQDGYNASTGQISYWVQVPTLSSSADTVVFVFYGNSSITSDQSNKTGVWDSNFVGVWHLPNGTTLTTGDSTSNGNNATNVSSVAATTGEIGGGASFNGSSNYLNVPIATSLKSIPAITSSLWMKTTHLNATSQSTLFSNMIWPSSGFALGDNGPYTSNIYFDILSSGTSGACNISVACFPRSLVNDGNWHYVVGVYDPSAAKVFLYLDGVLKNSQSAGTYVANTTSNLVLGAFAGGAGASSADEFRLSKAARSANWIATEYNNQSSPSTFETITAAANGGAPTPAISNISTSSGSVGVSLNLTGAGFGAVQGSSTVTVNGGAATPTSWSDSAISIPVAFDSSGNSYTLVVTVGGSASNSVSLTLVPGALPSPWADQDMGSVGTAGSAGFVNGVYTVNGAGIGPGGSSDNLNFAYQQLSGDGSIVARIANLQGGSLYHTGGVMIRESLNANAKAAWVEFQDGVYFGYRATTGGGAGSTNSSVSYGIPSWFEIVRSGNTFSAYTSYNGIDWVQVGTSQTISMATSVYIGLLAASPNSGALVTGTFDNVSVNSSASPAPVISGLSATTGSVGSQIVIAGSGFGSSQGGSIVTLNGLQMTVNNWSSTSITITIPSGASTGSLYVTLSPGMNDSNHVVFTVESNALPTPWLDLDIGVVGSAGSASYSGGAFTVSGSGGSMGAAAGDNFHFVYTTLSGDGTIIGRVTSAQGQSNGVVVAGVMMRETLNPQATAAFSYYFAGSEDANFSHRTSTGTLAGNDFLSGAQFLPYWFQIVRSGSSFSAYGSSDGSHWTQIGSTQTITMASNIYVGLGVSNNSNSGIATGTFDNVSVTEVVGPQTPSITSLSPSSGLVGDSITINGSNFGPTQSNSTVTFSDVTATVTSWTPTALTVTVPSGAITGQVVVTVGGLSSSGVNFTVLKRPTISSISPTYGGYGATVTITGTNYGATQGNSTVSFNGTNATSITSWSATQIVAVVPTGATTGQITVTVTGEPSVSNPTFTVYNPVITSITPSAAPIGGTVALSGSGFGSAPGTLAINGTSINTWTSWADTSLTFTIPSGSTSGPVTVTNHGVTSAGAQLTISPISPTSVSPSTGTTGITATISGSGFGPNQSTSTLAFNGFTATAITSWSDSQIVATVPDEATTGAISVTVGGITVQGPTFTVDAITDLTDSLGNQSTYTSNIFGGKWYNTDATGSGCSSCTTRGVIHNTYDTNGNLLTTTNESSQTTTNTFDSNNNLSSTSQQLDANTPVTNSYTYNSFGEVLTSTDPLGNVTTNTYDANGNLLTVTTPKPDSNTAASVTQFAYDTKGELTTITDPLSHVTTITYNAVGLIATITDAQNNVTTYGYDSHGNRTSVKDANNQTTTFAYDTGDRLTTITYPDTTTSSFTYDSRGRRITATDQNGKTTQYAYDDADRLTTVTDPATNVTTYAYDTENNLLSITDANSHATSFNYDAFGRVTQTAFPSSHTESYTYDAIGNLLTKTDRNGQTIQYVYDALNRLTQKSYPDSTAANYVYDLVSKIKQVTDPTGTYGFAYDNMGRLTGTTTQYSFLTGTTFTNAYAYDAASNRTGFTAPDGSTNSYSYDNLNRLTTLANSWAGSFGFSYDALSRRTQMTRPNGVNTNYAYDPLSRLLSVLHQMGGSTIDGDIYTLDAVGNQTSKTDQMAGVTSNYTYDALYQLTQVVQGANTSESYSYDAVGNRLSSLGVTAYSYNNSNELASTPNAIYTYDYNGNTTSKTDSSGTTNYTWDFENRLMNVTLPGTGGTVTFKYDPFARRIYKSSSNGTTIYTFDRDSLTEETDASGTAVTTFAQGLKIDEPLAMLRSGVSSYYQEDGLGSVTSLSNSVGSLLQAYTYNSFGKLTSSSGSLSNPFQYTGREFDSETALFFYRARYYDPATGRFVSEDPSATSGRENLFRYVGNNPVNLYDPSGWSQTKPKQIQPGSNAVFYICCRRGKLAVCDKDAGSYSGWVLDCMREHEKQHVADMTCGGKNPCKDRPDGAVPVDPDEKKTLECSAYRKELECLLPAGNTKEIQDRRNFVKKQIGNYCGGN